MQLLFLSSLQSNNSDFSKKKVYKKKKEVLSKTNLEEFKHSNKQF